MAAKNSTKTYSPESYYHIYNRGVEKRLIFQGEQDYGVFLSYLKTYLLPKNEGEFRHQLTNPELGYKDRDKILKLLNLNNFWDEIFLIAYCLMPNHFHLLIKQKSPQGIDLLMNSLGIRYSMYFNKKYKRVGSLYQDVYKAVLVETDEQLLYLTKYIHRNPLSILQGDGLRGYGAQPSSYPEYLGLRKTEWIHPEEILSFFSKSNPKLSYRSFVEGNEDIIQIYKIAIDS